MFIVLYRVLLNFTPTHILYIYFYASQCPNENHILWRELLLYIIIVTVTTGIIIISIITGTAEQLWDVCVCVGGGGGRGGKGHC